MFVSLHLVLSAGIIHLQFSGVAGLGEGDVYNAVSGGKGYLLKACQASDGVEMHGVLVTYYDAPTPTEWHCYCFLVCFWMGAESSCG